MAVAKNSIGGKGEKRTLKKRTKRTSIGCSENSRVNNKHKKRQKGHKYRGQGK